ncbi:MAG: GNAT family N-acetyltransferase [Proteobacteria bacterium]|nr:GNAT family N-acetyltransferase [Pseudomonadota bacterium]
MSSSAKSLIRGSRVFLRHPTQVDVDEFIALRQASRDVHQPWEPIPEDGSDPVSRPVFRRFLITANTPSSQKHLICRATDGAIVGYVGLSQIVMGPFCSSYMGYWVGKPYLRQGYATEGISLCVERAFTQLCLHRIEANIIPQNTASLATARKCGFHREGYSPRYLKIAGQWRDHERWAITVEDWQTQRSDAPIGTP